MQEAIIYTILAAELMLGYQLYKQFKAELK